MCARKHLEDAPGDSRIDRGASARGNAQSVRNLVRGRSLQQVARRPGADGAEDLLVVLEDGENDDRGLWEALAQGSNSVQAIDAGQFHVEEQDLRRLLVRQRGEGVFTGRKP